MGLRYGPVDAVRAEKSLRHFASSSLEAKTPKFGHSHPYRESVPLAPSCGGSSARKTHLETLTNLFGTVSWRQVRRNRPLTMQLDTFFETYFQGANCGHAPTHFRTFHQGKSLLYPNVAGQSVDLGRRCFFQEWCLTSGTCSSQTSA